MAREKSYEKGIGGFQLVCASAVGLRPVIPDATSQNLGGVGLQAFRCRNNAPNEVYAPPISRHLLVVTTSPPAQLSLRSAAANRQFPPPPASFTRFHVGIQ